MSASSDTSHNQSDSETEGAAEVVTTPTNQVTVAVNHNTPANQGTSVSQVTSPVPCGTVQSQHPALNIKPTGAVPACLKTPVTSRTKTRTVSDSSDQAPRPRRRSKTPDKISKFATQEVDPRRKSLSFSKRLSRSCDSLDTSGCQGNAQSQDNTSQSDEKQNGKLKAHRRKGRRAVTLHNLDTKQLMLILNLQMRYLEETKAYNSQKDINSLPSPRRAITPQPSSHQPKIPQNIRSHTPQPYRKTNISASQQERDFYAQVKSLIQNHVDKDGENDDNLMYSNHYNENVKNTAKHNPYLHENKVGSLDNMHYVTYSDNMLNLKGPKPKSRATVQDYFLPPQPLHRHNKNTLPPQPIRRPKTVEQPQPIRRQKSVDQNLPSEPVHRGKSAFHIVDCGRNNSRSSSISSERSDPSCTIRPASGQKKHQNDYAEVAIRDNFLLNQNPYMFKNTNGKPNEEQRSHNKMSDISSKSMKSYVSSEIPPPYTGPPSYVDFVSSCDNSGTSSTSSNQEEIYSMPVRRSKGQSSEGDKYSFEIESKSLLLRNERDRNYNVRQPNLDSVYGYTETLGDVQNCHGDIKVKGVRVEGCTSQGHSKAKESQGLVRDSVYNSPAKSKVKQYIVPEDYYTPINKVSRQTPVYANAKKVPGRINDESKHVHNKTYGVAPVVLDSGKNHVVKDKVKSPVGRTGKFTGYVYPDVTQIAPDEKYHEYEDVYDAPEADEPVLMTLKEVSQLKIENEGRSGQMTPQREPKKSSKASPKKSKVKPYTHPQSSRIKGAENSERITENEQSINTPRYKIPVIQVNDDDVTEDDVFINNDQLSNNGAINNDNKTAQLEQVETELPDTNRSHEPKSNDHCEILKHVDNRKHETYETGCEIKNQSMQVLADKRWINQTSGHPANQNGIRSDHVIYEANEGSVSDQERQIPEGTDESSDNLVGNCSEEEYAETGV